MELLAFQPKVVAIWNGAYNRETFKWVGGEERPPAGKISLVTSRPWDALRSEMDSRGTFARYSIGSCLQVGDAYGTTLETS